MTASRRDRVNNRRRTGPWWGAWWRSKFASRALVLAISLSCVASLTVLRATDPFVVRSARETAFDLLQRMSPREYVEAPVRIVDIDERSLTELGQWPWPRDMLAEFVDRLHAAGASTIAFDFIFAEPDRLSPNHLIKDAQLRAALGVEEGAPVPALPDNDVLFAEAMLRGFVVIGFGGSSAPGPAPPVKAGFAYTGEDPAAYAIRLEGGTHVLPGLAEAAAGIGSVTLSEELSLGVVRRMPLIWSDGERLYPSLVTEALRVAQGAQTYVVHADPATGGIQSVRVGAYEVPTEPTGELNMHHTPPLSAPPTSSTMTGCANWCPGCRGRSS
jgi:adenylate cyclase